MSINLRQAEYNSTDSFSFNESEYSERKKVKFLKHSNTKCDQFHLTKRQCLIMLLIFIILCLIIALIITAIVLSTTTTGKFPVIKHHHLLIIISILKF